MPEPSAPKHVEIAPFSRALMLALCLFVSFELSSCGPVVFKHGIATRADTVWRGVWQGVWVDTKDDLVFRVDFDSPDGARFYMSDSAMVAEYALRPVRIGRRWFADLYPLSVTRTKKPLTALELTTDSLGFDFSADSLGFKVSPDSFKVELTSAKLRLYHILRLETDAKGPTLAYLSDRYIDEFRSAHPKALPSEPRGILSGDDPLTSSTSEVRRFLSRYGEVDSLFDPLEPMTRQR